MLRSLNTGSHSVISRNHASTSPPHESTIARQIIGGWTDTRQRTSSSQDSVASPPSAISTTIHSGVKSGAIRLARYAMRGRYPVISAIQ